MTTTLITLLLGVGLSALALVATPLAARLTHRMPDPDSGYFSTTLMALLITSAFGGGAISSIIWIAGMGSTAAMVLIPAYVIVMFVVGRFTWKALGPHQHVVPMVPGARPAGA
ncbi:hypothetical protein [Thalassobaculum salexigens]|uniref:hypothetical protein n=1 Tax=Thalassobaculum salexigens TaxID=455360 RepID=UPI0004296334|nr:hypothetical protein [Thalassobaculum salexigens]